MRPNMTLHSYFTCTLGQAALYKKNHDFTNINQLIERNATEHGHLPGAGFCLPGSNKSEPWRHQVVTFGEVFRGSCATARLISANLTIPERDTVALLCPSTPAFLFTWLGLMRLGHPVLLIAPQCSPIAIAELCKQCQASLLLHDEIYEDLARAAVDETSGFEEQLQAYLLPFIEGVGPFELIQEPVGHLPKTYAPNRDDIAYLHHTSGTSSGIPKPIPQTHNAGAGVYAQFDGTQHATFTATPLYHGGIADLFRAWTSKALIWLFPGKEVPITATNVVKCLEAAERSRTPPVKYFSSVPYVLEMMASDERGLQCLQSMDVVGVGGAALPVEVGDTLVEAGVNLISRLGSAECGFLISSHRNYETDKEWQYLRAGEGSDLLRFERRDAGLSELIVLAGWPHMSKTNRENGSFATSDLFEPHPKIPDAWRYHSRADSQLTLITGKKFDPAPLEDEIAVATNLIQDVLIFGNGRPYPGALLFRSRLASEKDEQDVLSTIIPEVQKLNSKGQSHTHISRNMLFVLPYNEVPLEKSSKGTVLRKKAEERYATQIEAAYQSDSPGLECGSDDDVEEYILNIAREITSSSCKIGKYELQAQTDLFAYGLDSLACLQIRNAVLKLLPTDSELPLTVVQDAGSIRKLSEIVLGLRHGCAPERASMADRLQSMQDLVEHYSQIHYDDPVDTQQLSLSTSPRSQRQSFQTVLLTGSTGSLGSQVLSQLVDAPHVSHIHVLLRGATQQAAEARVRQALMSRKLSIAANFDSKVSVHRCSLSQPQLGLSAAVYAKLAREVDVIYHLAWSVDFILPLPAFKQHFAGLQSLLNISLNRSTYTAQTKKNNNKDEDPRAVHLILCSSTASVASFPAGTEVPETVIEDPSVSSELGYSSSKWVAENICARAAKAYPELRISIVRVGQLSGDRLNGVWNASEAYPLLLASLEVTGCLPDLPNESVGWVPVDLAATAFLELGEGRRWTSCTEEDGVQLFHLLSQDTTTTWGMLLQWLKTTEEFEVVQPREWLARLEEAASKRDGHAHPSLKLLDFWKRAYTQQTQYRERLVYATENSVQAMPVCKKIQPVDETYALRLFEWIRRHV